MNNKIDFKLCSREYSAMFFVQNYSEFDLLYIYDNAFNDF